MSLSCKLRTWRLYWDSKIDPLIFLSRLWLKSRITTRIKSKKVSLVRDSWLISLWLKLRTNNFDKPLNNSAGSWYMLLFWRKRCLSSDESLKSLEGIVDKWLWLKSMVLSLDRADKDSSATWLMWLWFKYRARRFLREATPVSDKKRIWLNDRSRYCKSCRHKWPVEWSTRPRLPKPVSLFRVKLSILRLVKGQNRSSGSLDIELKPKSRYSRLCLWGDKKEEETTKSCEEGDWILIVKFFSCNEIRDGREML